MTCPQRPALRLAALCFFVSLFSSATALGQAPAKQAPAGVPVTVSASGTLVRFAALGPVERMRLEVFDPSGAAVFDTGLKPGNVRDWRLAGAHDKRLPDATYLCVVTVREVSGRLSFKQGTVVLQGGRAALALEGGEPEGVEADRALAARPAAEPSAMTIVAHDGQAGQVTSTSGALTFRTGDVLAGQDRERVRVTPEGKVGIGTAKPTATLDVAGTIRAREGISFADGSVLTSARAATVTAAAPGDSPEPAVAGTGTAGRLTKWTDGAGTLGDSVVTELNNNIGVGTDTPNSKLHVVGSLEIGAASGVGVNPTITNPSTLANASQFQFYPAAGTNTNMSFAVIPRGTGLANNRAQFSVFNTDYLADQTNYEFAGLRARGNDFLFSSSKAGTGVVRPLILTTGANSNQLFLGTNGNVGVGTGAPAQKLEVAGSLKLSGAGSALIFPDGSSMTTAAGGGGSTGDITEVTAGTGLTGGGATGAVTLGINNGGVGTNQLADGAVTGAKVSVPLSLTASNNSITVLTVSNAGPAGGIGVGINSTGRTAVQGTGEWGVKGISTRNGGYGVQGVGASFISPPNDLIAGTGVHGTGGTGQVYDNVGQPGGKGVVGVGGTGGSWFYRAGPGGPGVAGTGGNGGPGGSSGGGGDFDAGDGGPGLVGQGGNGGNVNQGRAGIDVSGRAGDGVVGTGGAPGTPNSGNFSGGTGVKGIGGGTNGDGVVGQAVDGFGVRGVATGAGKAGRFEGELDVVGLARLRGSAVANNHLRVEVAGGFNDDIALSLAKRDNAEVSAQIIFDGFTSQSTHSGSIHFATRTSGSPLTGRAYFGPDGHFSPSADNTYSLGSSSNRWKDVWAVDGTVNTSDVRLKRDIRGLSYGLGEVMRLRPVSFGWKGESGGREHVGLLAQEVERVVPEAVRRGADPQATLGLNYAELTPVLIKAVQEQQQLIEQLRAQVTRQQAQLDRVSRAVRRGRAGKR